jgi:hypothetical protein
LNHGSRIIDWWRQWDGKIDESGIELNNTRGYEYERYGFNKEDIGERWSRNNILTKIKPMDWWKRNIDKAKDDIGIGVDYQLIKLEVEKGENMGLIRKSRRSESSRNRKLFDSLIKTILYNMISPGIETLLYIQE